MITSNVTVLREKDNFFPILNNLVKFYKMHPDWPAIWIDNWIKLKENTLILCTWFIVEMNVNQQDPFVFSNFSWKVTKFYGGGGGNQKNK